MTLVLILALQLLAFLVGLAEVLIPSFGVLTAVALALLGVSWYQIIAHYSQPIITFFFVGNLALVPVFIILAIRIINKSPLALKTQLAKGSSIPEESSPTSLIGAEGKLLTSCQPLGKAEIKGKILEVTADEGFIEKDTLVKIISHEGMKIIVQKV